MKMKKRRGLIFPIILCLLSGTIGAAKAQQQPWQGRQTPNERPLAQRQWGQVAERMPAEWYGTDEARTVAEQVLLYQRPSGGWPKNLPMHHPLTDEVRAALAAADSPYESTLDNGATTTEMKFLARVYNATGEPRYRESFDRGLSYIFEAQYDNGGWPQFYPIKTGYYTHITFNDNAMANILRMLRDISDEDPLYAFAATPKVRKQARAAFDKGIDCILKCQIVVDGKPTVWCAQHDEVTLKPAHARAYELPSFSGGESTGLVMMLMELKDPSPEVIASIEGAVRWLDDHKIEGLRFLTRMPDGSYDRHVVPDPTAPPIWARFYDLETGKPIFVGRDGVKRATLAEIEYERRNGYGYYVTDPQKALDAYPTWKERIAQP
jgi:pectinesterase